MMTILLGVFAIATGVSALYLERKLLRIQKPIETISVDSQKLRAKIGATPPLWMLSQIQKDLSKYEAGIKEKMLNEAFQGKRINQLALVRFTIKDRHLSFSLDERNLNSFRFKQVLASMQLLNQEVELPNVDFIVSLEDALDENCGMPLCPCFVFAKKETQDSLVLIPDFKALAGYHSLRDVIEKGNRKFSWKSKKAKGFWRGTSTGGHLTKTNWESFMRARLVLLSLKYPKEIDARFNHVRQCDPDIPLIMKKKGMVSKSIKKTDHLKYKYLVDIDGNSCTYERCFWILLSNSLLLKQESQNIQWYYGAIQPNKHYLAIKEDLSDLLQKISWAQEHDEEAQKISERATEFVYDHLSSEDTLLYMYLLLKEYARLQK